MTHSGGGHAAPGAAKAPLLGMVLKGYPRLSETFISNEIRLLEEEGFRIHIISMRPPRERMRHASVGAIRAEVTYLPEHLLPALPAFLWSNLRTCLRAPGRYAKALALCLRRFPQAPKKHTWLKHFLQAGYLLHVTRKGPPLEHFHAHFAHTPSSVALYAAAMAGTGFSFTAHAKDIYTQRPGPLRLKLRLARFCVTCTRYNQRHLQALAPADRDVHCVYHGIDLGLFSLPERPQMEARPPYRLLTVARCVEKKGLPRILEALALLREQGLDCTWTLVGSGDGKDALRARAAELGLEGRVIFTGAIPHEAVLEHFRQAHCFVLACQVAKDGDRDGIPNVLAESMAMGVPVVATDVSGIPELVEHERSGLLVPDAVLRTEGPAALAAALRRMLEDAPLRARVIPEARATVERIFDNKRLIRDLADIYRRHGLGPVETPCASPSAPPSSP